MWGYLVEAAFPTPKRPPLREETWGCGRGTAREHGGQHPITCSDVEEATKLPPGLAKAERMTSAPVISQSKERR